MSKLTIGGSIMTLLSVLAPLHAQSGANAPGDFMVERVLTLNSVVANTPPSFPDAVLNGLKNGVIELHQRFIYNSAQHSVEQLAFVVPANSPVPFPDPSGAPVGDHYFIQVDNASFTTGPHPSVVLVGHAYSNDVPTPWGDVNGAGVTLTFGYRTAGAAVQFNSILESVSPLYGLYTDSGAGSLSLTASAQKCSVASLSGTYMFQLGGSIQSANGWAPYEESGTFVADGKGSLTVLDSGNIGGSAFTGRTFPIAYAINDDCTGTFTFGSNSMDIQVSRDGMRMNMVFTKPSSIIAKGSGQLQ